MRGAFHFEVKEYKELVLEDETGLLILKDRADFSRLFTLFCPPLLPESFSSFLFPSKAVVSKTSDYK